MVNIGKLIDGVVEAAKLYLISITLAIGAIIAVAFIRYGAEFILGFL